MTLNITKSNAIDRIRLDTDVAASFADYLGTIGIPSSPNGSYSLALVLDFLPGFREMSETAHPDFFAALDDFLARREEEQARAVQQGRLATGEFDPAKQDAKLAEAGSKIEELTAKIAELEQRIAALGG